MLIRSALHDLQIKPLVTCLLVPLAIGNFACNSTVAATLQVSNCNDAGSGSLRDALASAHSGDNIDLTLLPCSTISLKTGELDVAVDDLTLKGPGAQALKIAGGLTVPAHQYAVVHHTGHGTLHIEALAITDNFAAYGSGHKFASRCIESTGTVDLVSSTVTQCNGGGIFAQGFSARDSTIDHSYQALYTSGGNVSIVDSTISNNISYVSCVALHLGKRNAASTGTALISNSTISGNESDIEYYSEINSAGCIYQPVTISNTTVAFNTSHPGSTIRAGLLIAASEAKIESSIFANNTSLDLNIAPGAHVSGHNNLIVNAPTGVPTDTISADPKLLPLASNGGRTQTHALATDSPAIDAGNNLAGLANDQRGPPFARSAGIRPDIGAFELQSTTANVSIGPGFTGSWFDPDQSGHGLMLQVLSDHRLLAMWFAFNPEGTQQSWFGGVGTYSGTTATITEVAQPTGGRWIPNFDPNSIVRSPWGTLTFTFTDCNHGRVDFSSGLGYGSGSMNLLRLTQPAGLTCP